MSNHPEAYPSHLVDTYTEMAAEVGAGVAIAGAVCKLSKFLYEQADSLLYIRDKFESLENELSWMRTFLEEAENKLDNNSYIRKWVSDVRDLAYDCEDVLDTFLVKQKTQPGCIPYTAKYLSNYDLGRKIEKLLGKANKISESRKRYGLDAYVSTTSDRNKRDNKLMQIRRSTPYANNEHMVGRDETISLLKGKLTNGESGRFVISIVGMGGLGKTTLARKLYNSLRQEKYFESYSWVCVSQEYNTRDILLHLIKSMADPTNEVLKRMTTEASMEAYLRCWLTERSFLVVLDDVWEREAWEILERAFPDNNKRSRVIITTRTEHVAALNSAYVHKLRRLQEDESWELFCKKAFPDDNEMICPSNLERLGREMVTKCSGLPLAIITLGGLLSIKLQVLGEWEVVRDNLWKELEKESTHIDAVLRLSYNDLPQDLKPCFLYVGMFPEDFEIPISQLILMWVAEGFIEQEEGCPEDTAKYYFNELVGRSLIQNKGEDWIASTCRVHDLLRDMAIRKAKEMRFSLYCDGLTTSTSSKPLPHRRLTYVACGNIPGNYMEPSLRTFCLTTTGNDPQSTIPLKEILRSLFERYSLLRVLDIQVGKYQWTCEIPGEIGRLIHLRYLRLSLPNAKGEFPETISNFKALETLWVVSDEPVTIPKTMAKLTNLRRLLIGKFDSKVEWIGRLTSLETLGYISYYQWCDMDTTRLVNLRHLSLTDIPIIKVLPTIFYDKFKNLTRLETLSLEGFASSISASEIFKRCPSITHFLSCGLVSFDQSADLHEFAVNLEVLEMVFNDYIRHDPIQSIKNLPKLRALRITMCPSHVRGTALLVCSEGGFTQLRTLKLEIYGDREFVVKEGSLPSLTHLEVNDPDKIVVPDRMKQLIIIKRTPDEEPDI